MHTTPKTKRRFILPTALTIGGLAIGIGIGSAGGTTTVSAPAPTATVTAEPEIITETVTETVEVETTPQACLDAIDHADGLILTLSGVGLLAAEYIDLIPRAFEAGMNYDMAASDQIIADMDQLNTQMEGIDGSQARADYDAAVTECQGEGV